MLLIPKCNIFRSQCAKELSRIREYSKSSKLALPNVVNFVSVSIHDRTTVYHKERSLRQYCWLRMRYHVAIVQNRGPWCWEMWSPQVCWHLEVCKFRNLHAHADLYHGPVQDYVLLSDQYLRANNEYDTSKCPSLVISGFHSHGDLNLSMLASTRVCENQFHNKNYFRKQT